MAAKHIQRKRPDGDERDEQHAEPDGPGGAQGQLSADRGEAATSALAVAPLAPAVSPKPATADEPGAHQAADTTAALSGERSAAAPPEAAPAHPAASAGADKRQGESPTAEAAGPGNPVHDAIRQAAEGGALQTLRDHTTSLRQTLLGPGASTKPDAPLTGQAPAKGAEQPDPALQGALGQTEALRGQAQQKAEATGAELAQLHGAAGQLASTPVELAPLDIRALMAEAGMNPESEAAPSATVLRKAEPGAEGSVGEEGQPDPVALQGLIEQLRGRAQASVSGFLAAAGGRIQSALAVGQAAPARLQAPLAAAQANISATVQAQTTILTAQFVQARIQAQAQAAAQQALIETQHSTLLTNIQSTTATATQQAQDAYQQMLRQIRNQERDQARTLGERYAQADRDYRACGVTVGQEAAQVGTDAARGYLSGKINREDSLLDGDLTDRRCEARANAASLVAQQYQAGIVEQAGKQADEAQKGKPRDLDTLHGVTAQSETTLDTQHQAILQQIQTAADGLRQQAEQAKTQFTQALDQALQGTLQSLTEQETSQLQALQTMGQQQLAALEQAGQSTIAALQQSVTQAVGGLQGSLGAVSGALANVAIPDPDAVSAALGGAMGQIEGGLASLQAQVEQGVTTATEQLMQQSSQVVLAMVSAGQQAGTLANGLVEQLTTQITQIQSGVQTAYGQMQQSHTDQVGQIQKAATQTFQQVQDGAKQAFDQINKNVDTAFGQALPALQQGLRGALNDERAKISEEAEKAAA